MDEEMKELARADKQVQELMLKYIGSIKEVKEIIRKMRLKLETIREQPIMDNAEEEKTLRIIVKAKGVEKSLLKNKKDLVHIQAMIRMMQERKEKDGGSPTRNLQ